MTPNFTVSLKNRLALTYALFISLALGILCFVINLFAGMFFTALIKENIAEKSREIVQSIGSQYNAGGMGFDLAAVEAIGMHFARDGYIIAVEDSGGRRLWDARSCDMQCCVDAINSIASRMEGRFGMAGALQKERYPVNYGARIVATVIIETYGPFFYSETETNFLNSLNRLLLMAGIVLIGIGVIVSAAISRTIVKPILTAAEAAQVITHNYSGNTEPKSAYVNIPDQYKTRELAALSRSINTLAGELEEAERRKKQLTSDIAHELRTPLTCLRGNIEAMIDGVYPADRERLENCHEEIIRLSNLVQDIDTLTALEWEAITLNKMEFDLAKLLQITAEQWRPAAGEKGVAIDLHMRETVITADYDRLKQVFINILSNAVKYTDEGSITVTVEALNERRGCLVTIADTGIGISEEDIPHIFERFYRTDKSRSRSTGGAGIGLTIAATIVQAHGGTIEVKSGKTGTAFSVALPYH